MPDVPLLHPPLVYIDAETGEERWVSSGLDVLGRECPDPVPLAPPVALGSHPTLADTVRHMLHHAKLRELADQQGFDSEEEAADFDVEDEPLAPGMTLFEAWAHLAERGLVEQGPPEPAGSPPAGDKPAPSAPPSSVPESGKGSAEGGGPPAPPPTPAPASGVSKGS